MPLSVPYQLTQSHRWLPNKVENQTSQQAKHTHGGTVVNSMHRYVRRAVGRSCAQRDIPLCQVLRKGTQTPCRSQLPMKRIAGSRRLVRSTPVSCIASCSRRASRSIASGWRICERLCMKRIRQTIIFFMESMIASLLPNAFNHPQTAHKMWNNFIRIIHYRSLRQFRSLLVHLVRARSFDGDWFCIEFDAN